jgi:hypothetical protein
MKGYLLAAVCLIGLAQCVRVQVEVSRKKLCNFFVFGQWEFDRASLLNWFFWVIY